MKNKKVEKWEDEFDKEFGEEAQSSSALGLYDFHKYLYKDVKVFICSLLQQQRKELIEEVRGMEKEECGCEKSEFGYHTKNCDLTPYGYNMALKDVVKLLRKI